MTLLRNSRRELAAEARLALDALRDPMLALLLALLAVLLVLAAQAPLAYRVDVGVEDGPGSDLPLVAGFHPRERDVQGTFRWTKDVSRIRLPGVGVRPLQVRLQFIAVSPEVVERGPRMIEVWANGVLAASLPVRPEGAIYRLMLPAPPTGDYLLELRSSPAGDERAIGAGLASFAADTRPGPALPAWRSTLIWLACVVPAWLALRRIGFVSRSAWWMLVPLCLLAGLAALLDPPRFAFGAEPSLVALVLAWMVGVAVGRSFPSLAALAQRLGVPLPAAHWRWLALIALVVLATRYGGKIYPDSMPGDIGFHANRLADVARGTVLLVSRNRGVDFPYPPALYLLLMPFLLAGASARVALQLGGALMDAVSVVLVYGLAAAVVGRRGEEEKRRGGEQPLLFSVPLLAAALYSFSAAGYMVTWWNFSTHIFAQFAHLLLVTALVVVWPMVKDREPRTENREPRTENREPRTENREPRTENRELRIKQLTFAVIVLQLLVYLAHFGFWMNMSLLGAFALAVLLGAAWRGRVAWAGLRTLLIAFVAAQVLAVLLFYSGYAGLLWSQAQATAAGGLTGLAGRAPVGRDVLWTILWDYGLRTHYGFVLLPLAICGGWLLAHRATSPGRRVALVLMLGTLLIALFFAVLPFVSGSTLSSRWLMFSAWAVAFGAAVGAGWLWRRGTVGRLLMIVAGSYVFWITAAMWLMAMIWRIRPPEPF
jgi:MFS family permease